MRSRPSRGTLGTVRPDSAFVADRDASLAGSGRPSWLALWARPEYVGAARRFAATAVSGLPFDPYEISLVTSDLVTNAILTAAACLPGWPEETDPIGVQLQVTHRYVHLAVTDSDNRSAGWEGLLAAGGRGMAVVDRYAAARWVTRGAYGKTVHVVIPASGVELTTAELIAVGVPA